MLSDHVLSVERELSVECREVRVRIGRRGIGVAGGAIAGGTGHGENAVAGECSELTGPAFAPGLDELSTVARVDDDGNMRDPRGEACTEMQRGAVGMHDSGREDSEELYEAPDLCDPRFADAIQFAHGVAERTYPPSGFSCLVEHDELGHPAIGIVTAGELAQEFLQISGLESEADMAHGSAGAIGPVLDTRWIARVGA